MKPRIELKDLNLKLPPLEFDLIGPVGHGKTTRLLNTTNAESIKTIRGRKTKLARKIKAKSRKTKAKSRKRR